MKTRRIKLKEKYSRKHKGGAAPPPPETPPPPPPSPPPPSPPPPAPPPPDPALTPASEDISEFIKDIRRNIINEIKKYNPAQRMTFKKRIELAISNAKNGLSSNTTRKSNSEPESNKIESMKFKDVQNFFINDLSLNKINSVQITYIKYLIDYYKSYSGFTGRTDFRTIDKDNAFTDDQYKYLINTFEKYRSNTKFNNNFTNVLRYIETKLNHNIGLSIDKLQKLLRDVTTAITDTQAWEVLSKAAGDTAPIDAAKSKKENSTQIVLDQITDTKIYKDTAIELGLHKKNLISTSIYKPFSEAISNVDVTKLQNFKRVLTRVIEKNS
jgi:hypothetical protein